jgi:hypothetical protein
MKKIEANFIWTFDDLLNGKAHAPVHRILTGLKFIGSLIFAVTAIQMVRLENFHVIYLGAIGVMLWMTFGSVVERWLTRREFSKCLHANSEVTYTFSEEGVQTSRRKSNSIARWPDFHKVIHTSDGFVLIPNRDRFLFIPNRAFHSARDIAMLKGLARSKVRHFKEA